VGKLYQQASFLAYPTEFAEIDCISVKKAQAAGARVVATDFGALPESTTAAAKLIHSSKTKETWNKPYQFHFGLEGQAAQHDWVEAMVEVLKGNRWNESVTRQWSHQFEWPRIAARWNDILKA
jgi:glycosyltransferase involved in cell wall biosynthesis